MKTEVQNGPITVAADKCDYSNIKKFLNISSDWEPIKIDRQYTDKCIPLVNFLETYQGEGPNCGKRMILTRFKYCNKLCPFCDTQGLTSKIIPTMYSLKDIEKVLKNSSNLMITGGEPTLMNNVILDNMSLPQFDATVFMIRRLNYEFLDIETNGLNLIPLHAECECVAQNACKNINISWSPKFINENDFMNNVEIIHYLKSCSECCVVKPIIKIVIGDDMKTYEDFIYQAVLHYGFDSNRVYLMPKGTTYDEIQHSMDHVLTVASELKCNVSSRLHILHNFK